MVIVADHRGWLLAKRPGDLVAYDGVAARVVAVPVSDTLEVALPDRRLDRPTTHVRLWGVRPRHGEAVRELTRSLAEGRTVILHLEPHRTRAALGRVLAHVELPDGTLLNARLLSAGVAVADDRRPHAWLGHYARLERSARHRTIK